MARRVDSVEGEAFSDGLFDNNASADPRALPEQYESSCPYSPREPGGPLAPKFRLIEQFADGSVYTGDSFGDWKYIDDGETRPCSMACLCRQHKDQLAQHFTFVVRKAHGDPQLFTVQFHDNDLFQRLAEVLPYPHDVTGTASIRGLALLRSYSSLKYLITSPSNWANALLPYLNLLVNGFLADGDVFKSFGYERLYELGGLTFEHWLEFQHNRIEKDISMLNRGYYANKAADDFSFAILEDTTESGTSGSSDTTTMQPSLLHAELPENITGRRVENRVNLEDLGTLPDAAADGNENAVKYLLEHETDPDILRTALSYAADNGYEEIVQLLLEHGADPANYDLRYVSEYYGHERTVELLLEYGADPFNYYLSDASQKGYERIVQLLLQHGVDSNDYDSLWGASGNGFEGIVQLLLQYGADPNNYNALLDASERGHEGIVQLLLQHGANANNYNALCGASKNGHESVVQLLLDHGADPDNFHALWEASKNGHDRVLQLLVDRGVGSKSHFFARSLFDVTEGNPNIARVISGRIWAESSPLPKYQESAVDAALKGNALTVRFLLENWPRLDIDDQSISILQAAKQGDTAVVWSLLNKNLYPRRATPSQILAATKLLMEEGRSARLSTFYTTFKRSHEKIIQARETSTEGFHEFAERITNRQRAWEIGVSTLRRICKGRQPENLEEIITFLCIAWSMLRTIDEDAYDMFRSIQFRQDLRRWKFLLPELDHDVYEEAIIALCGGYGEGGDDLDLRIVPEDLRLDLQGLACSLVSESSRICNFAGFSDESLLSSQERWRLRLTEIEEKEQMDAFTDLEAKLSDETVHEVDPAAEPPNRSEKSSKPRLKDRVNSDEYFVNVDLKVVFLLLGAVFISVLQFLLWTRMTSLDMIWGSLITHQANTGTQGNFYDVGLLLKPACTTSDRIQLLEKYLDLETTTLDAPTPQLSTEISFKTPPVSLNISPASASSERTGSVVATWRTTQQLQRQSRFRIPAKDGDSDTGNDAIICDDCRDSFSSRTNFLRHQRERHEVRKFPCENCGKKYSREDYLRKHKCKAAAGPPGDRGLVTRKRKADGPLGGEGSKKLLL